MNLLEKIPFSKLESIPELVKNFLDDKLTDYDTEIFSLENFEKKIEEKSLVFSVEQRQILSEVLKDQLSELTLSGLQHENLASIHNHHTFTVTTGHQLNLFTGPVFFIYKILQTVKTALFLKESFPECNFVPVFWMATEDHDFEEINHFKTRSNFYETSAVSGGAVGRIKLTDLNFIEEFQAEFQDHIFGTELSLMIKEAYTEGRTLAHSTKILVQRLFGEYGLLIIDGDDPKLKAQMKQTFRDEIINSEMLIKTEEKVQHLREQYGKVQVNPREINLFYLTETRNRIDRQNGSYRIDGTDTVMSEDEILSELENYPERFSPNALMRPVYQEKILPNLAYIGGNAEIMYWLELKDYFKHIKIPFPVLIPRSSILMLSGKDHLKVEKLGLNIKDFFRNFSDLTSQTLLHDNKIAALLNEKQKSVESIFSDISKVAESTDISFGNLVQAEQARQLKSFKRMQKRLLRAEKIKQAELLERLEKMFIRIHPGKTWQERVWNFSVFYADHGKQWLDTCLEHLDVRNSELIILVD